MTCLLGALGLADDVEEREHPGQHHTV
jgi:hypothetical protein